MFIKNIFFNSHDILNGLESCGLLVWAIIVMFYQLLDSHSDGTQSL